MQPSVAKSYLGQENDPISGMHRFAGLDPGRQGIAMAIPLQVPCSTTGQNLRFVRRFRRGGRGVRGEALLHQQNRPALPKMNLLVPDTPGCDILVIVGHGYFVADDANRRR
jgi:hypothetical protein